MKIKHFALQSLFFSLFIGGIGLCITTLPARAEILPDIEAHQFKIVPLEKSRTGRVYRFRTEAEQLPKTGSILLIEENEKPTMAFRVMKTDRDHAEFVAKRVRRYDISSELKINQRYTTVEKISDLVTPPPTEPGVFDPNAVPLLDPNPLAENANANPPVNTPAAPPASVAPAAPVTEAPPATANVAENPLPEPTPIAEPLNAAKTDANPPAQPADPGTFTPAQPPAEKGMDVEKYDTDLDSSTSPTDMKSSSDGGTPGSTSAPPPPVAVDDDGGYDLEVKERTVLMPFKYMAGFAVGSLKNISNLKLGNQSYGGFSAYFSQVIRRNLVFKKAVPQDSLSVEYGFSYYSDDNVNAHNDNYTILPIKIELRYDIHLCETFTPFAYLGLQYNLILTTENVDLSTNSAGGANTPGDVQAYDDRHGPQVNVGVGLLYNMGPQWYLRADIGLDRLAFGIAIKW